MIQIVTTSMAQTSRHQLTVQHLRTHNRILINNAVIGTIALQANVIKIRKIALFFNVLSLWRQVR